MLTDVQNEFLVANGLSVTDENGTFTLHYLEHKCEGLSLPELDHILNEYISGKIFPLCLKKGNIHQPWSGMNNYEACSSMAGPVFFEGR